MKDLEDQVSSNTNDITFIKSTLHRLETNHIFHIEKDMEKVKTDTAHLKEKISDVDRKVEKMDNRVWWILGLLVVGIIVPAFINGLMGG